MSEQDISAEVEELRQQRDQARTEFDSLGPVIEGLEKARSHIRADNKRLFQRVREEEALAAKWQQRAEAAEAEAARSRERLADAQVAIDERDAELTMLREALDTIPLHEYGDARREGCDAKGAWDCFKEALAEHISAVRSVSAVYDAKNDTIDLRQQLATVTDLVPEVDLMKRAADYALCTAAARHQPIAPGVQEDADHRTLIMLAARIRAWRGDGGEEGEGESDGD